MSAPQFDAIIIGGSFSGMSAAMSLGRALRSVLIIDDGLPCNRFTPHSHNLITHDGKPPAEIAALARADLAAYPHVQWHIGRMINIQRSAASFIVSADTGESFTARKVLLAAGIRDLVPAIPGLQECWGISAIHCPYCHGYEYRGMPTGLLASGEMAMEMAPFLTNWASPLFLFTNGEAAFQPDQLRLLSSRGIVLREQPVARIVHNQGRIKQVLLHDGEEIALSAIYIKPPFVQNAEMAVALGAMLDERGYFKVNMMQETDVPGLFAAGDSTSPMRSLSFAMASGTMAGAAMSRQIILES